MCTCFVLFYGSWIVVLKDFRYNVFKGEIKWIV